MLEYKDALAVLATLVASFAGAWGAFLLENKRRERESVQRNIGAANRAIYTLFNLWNVLEQYRKEVLEAHRGKEDAWLNLAANPTIPAGEHTFQANELQFLLQSKKAEIFAALLLEEQRFGLAMDLIKIRSTLIFDEVFPKMSAAGIGVGQKMEIEMIEKILGVGLTHKLKQITAAIFKNTDENLASLQAQYGELRQAVQALYPKQKLIQIQFSDVN